MMKRYDTIIIGGGLAGLVCGIALVRGGRRVGLVSGGRSSLGYFSGSLELSKEGLSGFDRLIEGNPSHPYALIGTERVVDYTQRLKAIFADAGIPLMGDAEHNHLRLTPLGVLKPAWLTLDDFVTFDGEEELAKSTTIVGVEGNLNFNPEFVAHPFRERGAECRVATVALDRDNIEGFAQRVSEVADGTERVLLPAMFSAEELATIREIVGRRVSLGPMASTSMAGASVERALVERFCALGGEVFQNQRATACRVENQMIVGITTSEGEDLEGNDFVLATGSFFGGGLVATPQRVCESVVGVDVAFAAERDDWYSSGALSEQPFERFGVVTDEEFHPMIEGAKVSNLYAVGALLAGVAGVTDGCGGGVATLSVLCVAEKILE